MLSPELSLFILAVVVASTIAGLAHVIRRSRRRAPEEAGLAPSYADRGGGTFGLFRVSAPFVRIAVYPQQIVISALDTYVLPVQAIRSVSFVRGIFGRRVKLVHEDTSVPNPVLLWTNTPDALAAAIRGVAPHAFAAG